MILVLWQAPGAETGLGFKSLLPDTRPSLNTEFTPSMVRCSHPLERAQFPWSHQNTFPLREITEPLHCLHDFSPDPAPCLERFSAWSNTVHTLSSFPPGHPLALTRVGDSDTSFLVPPAIQWLCAPLPHGQVPSLTH